MKSINPHNNEIIFETSAMNNTELNNIINLAENDFNEAKNISIEQRCINIKELGKTLEKEKEDLAKLITNEMGKTLKESIAEIEKCIFMCEYFSENAKKFISNEVLKFNEQEHVISYQPLGVIFAIMPWNFPFWQVFRFAIPAIIAGNSIILKHASNVSLCAIKLQELFLNNNSKLRTIFIESRQVEQVIANPIIKAVTFTGSTKVGKIIAELAGKNLKKSVLELGGNDPYIIFDDADIENAAKKCVDSRLINAGQSCISAKRFIVVKDKYKEFIEYFSKFMAEKTYGDPYSSKTNIGPLASIGHRDNLHKLVLESQKMGAKIALGGELDKNNALYPPSILTDVDIEMPAFKDELFGPVAAIIKADNNDHAISLANKSIYGLGAAIFSADVERARSIALRDLEAGILAINDFIKSDPRLPFGGIKQSGYGRESSYFGIREFVNIKTLSITS